MIATIHPALYFTCSPFMQLISPPQKNENVFTTFLIQVAFFFFSWAQYLQYCNSLLGGSLTIFCKPSEVLLQGENKQNNLNYYRWYLIHQWMTTFYLKAQEKLFYNSTKQLNVKQPLQFADYLKFSEVFGGTSSSRLSPVSCI